ncbi:LCP family protein [Ornithinimicrobium sp. INDO-MA30-4]|uniref:LCP family protein n=1 Tax=Ornithinimicrobium sp. INDO-MA30-4 TaxID=2908651 RepID=UPI001F2032B3|nr:LCP family protein [Ornithinimicrobium sp. INDO-MA30-4]UJH71435.1 LCP family protein [Ornithinimicrobium sp. INDO-MA30-4]
MPHNPEDDWTRPIPRSRRGEPIDDWEMPAKRRTPPADQWDEGGWVEPRGRREAPRDLPTDRQVQGERAAYRSNEQRRPAGQRAGGQGPGGAGPRPPSRPRPPGPPPRRPRYKLRRFLVVFGILVLAYVVAMIWAIGASWGAIGRVDATPDTPSPGDASGKNILMIGTDSRDDLTDEERAELKTGAVEGARADTIMLLHLPDGGGEPMLVSLPRDSYVEIPGFGFSKINAAYADGGAPLMVATVEQATGLPIDGYLEVGFDGFVDVVAAVGGVEMCLDEPIVEERSDLDLPAGCQELEGKDALNYVRMRYADPRGDLGRVERQREFLSSLVNKMTGPGTLFVPWNLHDAGTATGSSLTIGDDTSMLDMYGAMQGMRSISNGDGMSVTVPIADANYSTAAGSSVLWDEAGAAELFNALRTDSPLTIEP